MHWGSVSIAALLFGIVTASICDAATIRVAQVNNGPIVLINGDFVSEDISEFQAKTGPLSKAIIILESDGGSVLAGIQIGETIRLKNFATFVSDGTRCASACALAWLGGAKRYMGPGARVGFHA